MDSDRFLEGTPDACCGTAKLGADDKDTTDRRLDGRLPLRGNIMVRLIAKPSFQPYNALLHDFSARGMQLVMRCALELGTKLAVQLQTKRAGVSGILTGTVVHVNAAEDGTWLIGCVLSRALSDAECYGILLGPRSSNTDSR
jgi:hypothetical protein